VILVHGSLKNFTEGIGRTTTEDFSQLLRINTRGL